MDCAVCLLRPIGADRINRCCTCTSCCCGRFGQRRCGFHTPHHTHGFTKAILKPPLRFWPLPGFNKPSCYFKIFLANENEAWGCVKVAECTFTCISSLWNPMLRLWLVKYFSRPKCHWTLIEEAKVYSLSATKGTVLCVFTQHPFIFKNGTIVSVQVWEIFQQHVYEHFWLSSKSSLKSQLSLLRFYVEYESNLESRLFMLLSKILKVLLKSSL